MSTPQRQPGGRGNPALLAGIGVAALILAAIVALLAGATTILVGGALPGGGCGGDGGAGGGSQQVGPRTWNAEQTENAQTIVTTVIARGLPKRAAVIATATAIVESELRNVGSGDRDSLGLFQQRPSQGWGTPAQILNPALATGEFLAHLVDIANWEQSPLGVVAQAVQRSLYPDRYAPQEAAAAALVDRFWAGPDNPAPPATSTTSNSTGAGGRNPLAVLAGLACPDQGGAGGPLGPSTVDPRQLPPGFTLPADPAQKAAVSYALAQLGKPYVWGAKGPNAFDCSGLMLAAWATAGIPIPAGTVSQKNAGTPNTLTGLAPGDLIFIPGSLGSPTNPRHVGMYAGHGLIVNAYDDQTGVVLQPIAQWRNQIVGVRHIAGPTGAPPALTPAA